MMKYNTEFQGGLTAMQRAEQAYIDSILSDFSCNG